MLIRHCILIYLLDKPDPTSLNPVFRTFIELVSSVSGIAVFFLHFTVPALSHSHHFPPMLAHLWTALLGVSPVNTGHGQVWAAVAHYCHSFSGRYALVWHRGIIIGTMKRFGWFFFPKWRRQGRKCRYEETGSPPPRSGRWEEPRSKERNKRNTSLLVKGSWKHLKTRFFLSLSGGAAFPPSRGPRWVTACVRQLSTSLQCASTVYYFFRSLFFKFGTFLHMQSSNFWRHLRPVPIIYHWTSSVTSKLR